VISKQAFLKVLRQLYNMSSDSKLALNPLQFSERLTRCEDASVELV